MSEVKNERSPRLLPCSVIPGDSDVYVVVVKALELIPGPSRSRRSQVYEQYIH